MLGRQAAVGRYQILSCGEQICKGDCIHNVNENVRIHNVNESVHAQAILVSDPESYEIILLAYQCCKHRRLLKWRGGQAIERPRTGAK